MPFGPAPASTAELAGALQRVAIHGSGTVAAAVDCHGGVHIFDLRRHTRARVWQEGPFSGALCFARVSELLLAVGNKVRVIDIRNRQHLVSLLGHKEVVCYAAATSEVALTFSQDRLMLWQVSDWSLLRRVEPNAGSPQLMAATLTSSQVGALYRAQRSGRLSWSLWSLEDLQQNTAPVAAGTVPRLDGVPVMCMAQLACGDGFVSMVVKKKKSKTHEVLAWKVPSSSYGTLVTSNPLAPAWRWPLQGAAVPQQLLARQRWIFLGCAAEVLVMELATGQLQQVPWLGLASLDVATCGLAVGLQGPQRTFAMKHLRPPSRPRPSSRKRSTSRSKPCPSLKFPMKDAVPEAQAPQPSAQPGACHAQRLAQFLRRFGGFGKGKRPHCWQILLQLEGDQVAYDKLGCEQEPEPISTRLQRWRPELQQVSDPTVAAAVHVATQVFSAHEVFAFELAAKMLTNWMAPVCLRSSLRQLLLQWVERQLRHQDLELSIYLEVLVQHLPGTSNSTVGSAVLWPMAQGLLLQCLPWSTCMVLWDHLILSWREPWLLFLAAAAVLRCKRAKLLHLSPSGLAADAMKLILRPTETDPVELLQDFQGLRSAAGADRQGLRQLEAAWSGEGAEEEVELPPVPVPAQTEDVAGPKDQQTQTDELCAGDSSDFAQLLASLAASDVPEPVVTQEEADELEAEKNDFLRFRAAIRATSGDAAADQSTVLPSSQPTVLETEVKAGLARLDMSLDSTTLDFPEFSDSGFDVCT